MEIKKCKKCGYELFPLDTVCDRCGTKNSAVKEENKLAFDNKKTIRNVNPMFIKILMLSIIFALILCGTMFGICKYIIPRIVSKRVPDINICNEKEPLETVLTTQEGNVHDNNEEQKIIPTTKDPIESKAPATIDELTPEYVVNFPYTELEEYESSMRAFSYASESFANAMDNMKTAEQFEEFKKYVNLGKEYSDQALMIRDNLFLLFNIPSPNDGRYVGEALIRYANLYNKSNHFSYQRMIKQLIFDGYSEEEAAYAANNCNAKWRDNALESAKTLVIATNLSCEDMVDYLIHDGFLEEDAIYAANNCGADWKEEAAEAASTTLSITSMTRLELIDHLIYAGFTETEAIYAADKLGL